MTRVMLTLTPICLPHQWLLIVMDWVMGAATGLHVPVHAEEQDLLGR